MCRIDPFSRFIEMQPVQSVRSSRNVASAAPRLRRAVWRCGVASLACALLAATAHADDWSDCPFGGGPKTEQACTAVITQAARSPQDLANAYARRGAFYRGQQKLDQAFADYAEALKLDPDSWEGHFGRGLTYRLKGQPDEALADYDRAIAIDPRRPL